MRVDWTDPYGLVIQGNEVIITDVPLEVRKLLLNTKAPYRISVMTSAMTPGAYLRKCEETGTVPPADILTNDEVVRFPGYE